MEASIPDYMRTLGNIIGSANQEKLPIISASAASASAASASASQMQMQTEK